MYDSSGAQPRMLDQERTRDHGRSTPLGPFELASPELAGAMAALRRARKRAEEIAAATGTAIVLEIDGKIVRAIRARVPPSPRKLGKTRRLPGT